jgi:predicted XRE-type DNA-binding protein
MKRQNLNQSAAAERMGIPQPKVSALVLGDFTNLSERKLLDRLDYHIEIRV